MEKIAYSFSTCIQNATYNILRKLEIVLAIRFLTTLKNVGGMEEIARTVK
jgi:hypothetical protein